MALAIFGLALAVAYSPTWSRSFGFMDDYNVLNGSVQNKTWILPVCVGQGRPLDGVILYALFSRIHHISGLRLVRIVSLAFMVLATFVFYVALRRGGWPRWGSTAAAVVMGTLPAAQVYVAWGVEMGQPLALALAGLAALLVWQVDRDREMSRGRAWRIAGAGVISLTASVLIYQPAAMVYWVFVAIDLLRPTGERTARFGAMARYGVVALAALALGAVAVWWGMRHAISLHAAQRATLIRPGGVMDKLAYFGRVVEMSLNLSNIDTRWDVAMGVGLLIVTGLPIYLWKTSRRWEMLAVAAVLAPLAHLPNLVVTNNWPSFRTQAGLEWLVGFYVLLAMQGWWWVLKGAWLPGGFIAVLAAASAIAARYIVLTYFVLPQTIELRLAQSLLNDQQLAGASRIEVIGADWSDTAAPGVYYEEFGQPTTYRRWGAIPMVQLLLASQHPAYRDMEVDFVTGEKAVANGTVVVDMRRLREFRNRGN